MTTNINSLYIIGLIAMMLFTSCGNSIQKLNQQIKYEDKIFRIGLNKQEAETEDFYSIRMDVQFRLKKDFQNLFEAPNFNYIMNDICKDFKFLDGSDTVSCSNNFTTFNHTAQSVSFICLFPSGIKKADQIFIRKNCFLTNNLTQEL